MDLIMLHYNSLIHNIFSEIYSWQLLISRKAWNMVKLYKLSVFWFFSKVQRQWPRGKSRAPPTAAARGLDSVPREQSKWTVKKNHDNHYFMVKMWMVHSLEFFYLVILWVFMVHYFMCLMQILPWTVCGPPLPPSCSTHNGRGPTPSIAGSFRLSPLCSENLNIPRCFGCGNSPTETEIIFFFLFCNCWLLKPCIGVR